MYTRPPGLQGFFLFDAVKAAAGAVVGAVKGAVGSIAGVQSQTGSGTPVYVQQAPIAAQTNYTPWLLGGAAVLGVLLLSRSRK